MNCPRCGSRSRVLDTREKERSARRSRVCVDSGCLHRFSTTEITRTLGLISLWSGVQISLLAPFKGAKAAIFNLAKNAAFRACRATLGPLFNFSGSDRDSVTLLSVRNQLGESIASSVFIRPSFSWSFDGLPLIQLSTGGAK